MQVAGRNEAETILLSVVRKLTVVCVKKRAFCLCVSCPSCLVVLHEPLHSLSCPALQPGCICVGSDLSPIDCFIDLQSILSALFGDSFKESIR
jgi:hypothetical protein